MKKKILIGVLIFIVVIQLFRIDQANPPINIEKDIITLKQPPVQIANMLKSACYDCHSFETNYPWYSNVAPVSWLVARHRDHGRKHLNFSIWGEYSENKFKHKLEECVEMIEEGEMPMESYIWLHPEADLSDVQKEVLMSWFMKEMR